MEKVRKENDDDKPYIHPETFFEHAGQFAYIPTSGKTDGAEEVDCLRERGGME
jgi:hypothetical protein